MHTSTQLFTGISSVFYDLRWLSSRLSSLLIIFLIGSVAPQAHASHFSTKAHPIDFTDPIAQKTSSFFAHPIPETVLAKLKQAEIPLAAVSIVVERVGAASPALSLHAEKSMNPASTMKLLTTSAGLSLLGPHFQWETRAYIDGPIEGGVLHGNLYIYGTGDPKLVPETFIYFIEQIRRAGITHIQGDLVLDRSYFDLKTQAVQAFDSGHNRAYNVSPDPLLYAFNALTFTLTPQPDLSVFIQTQPELAHLQLTNTLHATSGKCTPGSIPKPVITERNGTLYVTFKGTYPLQCGIDTMSRAAPNRNNFFANGFLALWEQTGGTHSGGVREALVPKLARCVALYKGEVLQDSVRDINKNSNNIMARNLFLTLGAIYGAPPATAIRSEKVIRHWLRREGLNLSGLVLENGAGLSSKERLSATGLTALLQHISHSTIAAPLIASLPVAGLDGTMRKRLFEGPSVGSMHIKTGTLDEVRAIAGYVTAHNAQNYIVVSFINHPNASRGQAAHDALLSWVYDTAP